MTVVEQTAQAHLVTYGMASFTLCKAGYVFFAVMYPLYLVYEVDIDILAHFKIKFCVTIMVMFSLHY